MLLSRRWKYKLYLPGPELLFSLDSPASAVQPHISPSLLAWCTRMFCGTGQSPQEAQPHREAFSLFFDPTAAHGAHEWQRQLGVPSPRETFHWWPCQGKRSRGNDPQPSPFSRASHLEGLAVLGVPSRHKGKQAMLMSLVTAKPNNTGRKEGGKAHPGFLAGEGTSSRSSGLGWGLLMFSWQY